MSGETQPGTSEWFRRQAADAIGQPTGVPVQPSQGSNPEPGGLSPGRVMMAIWDQSPVVQQVDNSNGGQHPRQPAPLPSNLFGGNGLESLSGGYTSKAVTAPPDVVKSHGFGFFLMDVLPKSKIGRSVLTTAVVGGLTLAALMKMNVGPADMKNMLDGWLNKDPQKTLLFKTDCVGSPQAAFRAQVNSTASVLPRLRFYASEADAAKAKANPKDPSIQYFDGFPDVNDPDQLKAAYVANLPKTPFTAEAAGEPRLPRAVYAADLGFVVCTKPDAGAKQPVVSETGSVVTIDANQLAIVITDFGAQKQNAHEMPTFVVDATKPGAVLLPPDETSRLNAVFHPDTKDVTKPNIPLLNSYEINTLDATLNGSCAEDIFEAAKNSIINILNKQNGTNIERPSWTGGFGLPTDGLKNKPADQLGTKDAKIIDLQAHCTVRQANSN